MTSKWHETVSRDETSRAIRVGIAVCRWLVQVLHDTNAISAFQYILPLMVSAHPYLLPIELNGNA